MLGTGPITEGRGQGHPTPASRVRVGFVIGVNCLILALCFLPRKD